MAAVTSQGLILHLAAPATNAHYSLEFFGPSLSCGPSSSITQLDVSSKLSELRPFLLGDGFNYIGFVPHYNYSMEDETDTKQLALEGLRSTLLDSENEEHVDYASHDYARLYIALPGLATSSTPSPPPIECGLYNSLFLVNFTFIDGQQDLRIINSTRLNAVNSRNTQTHSCASATGGTGDCYAAETIYISMLSALGTYVVGMIRHSHYGYSPPVRTQIMRSIFMHTQELHKMFAPEEPLSIVNMSMAAALEQVFTNATLSLFSDSYFL